MKTSQERRPELTERQGASDVRAVALLLPGGSITSRRKPLKIVEWGMRAPLTLTTTFVLDTLGGRQPDDEIVSAMAAEDGLSTPLFTGSRLTGSRR